MSNTHGRMLSKESRISSKFRRLPPDRARRPAAVREIGKFCRNHPPAPETRLTSPRRFAIILSIPKGAPLLAPLRRNSEAGIRNEAQDDAPLPAHGRRTSREYGETGRRKGLKIFGRKKLTGFSHFPLKTSQKPCRCGGIGRRKGLKIPCIV